MSLLQVPATISKASTMSNRCLRLQIDTQENLSDEEITGLMTKIDKYGHFCFLEDKEIDESMVIDLPALPKKLNDEKSPSLRFRNTLYVYWKEKGEKGSFELFYNQTYEKLIKDLKEKLT